MLRSKHRIFVFLFYSWGNWHQMSISNLSKVTWQSGIQMQVWLQSYPSFYSTVSPNFTKGFTIDWMASFYNDMQSIVFIKNWFMHKILQGMSICITWNTPFYVHKSFNLLSPVEKEEFWNSKEETSTTAHCLQKNYPYAFWGHGVNPNSFIQKPQNF